eukprot:TRINITY_DN3153_c0_g1_i4.p1 TRINITY_DN3153_c0_g1~~TRINITY_DN3153_c0_g1_i4.p1  ORF type:complete len:841 (+),score=71.75 TRINITY_DN3153_c0_g1_i4:262-2523(+)
MNDWAQQHTGRDVTCPQCRAPVSQAILQELQRPLGLTDMLMLPLLFLAMMLESSYTFLMTAYGTLKTWLGRAKDASLHVLEAASQGLRTACRVAAAEVGKLWQFCLRVAGTIDTQIRHYQNLIYTHTWCAVAATQRALRTALSALLDAAQVVTRPIQMLGLWISERTVAISSATASSVWAGLQTTWRSTAAVVSAVWSHLVAVSSATATFAWAGVQTTWRSTAAIVSAMWNHVVAVAGRAACVLWPSGHIVFDLIMRFARILREVSDRTYEAWLWCYRQASDFWCGMLNAMAPIYSCACRVVSSATRGVSRVVGRVWQACKGSGACWQRFASACSWARYYTTVKFFAAVLAMLHLLEVLRVLFLAVCKRIHHWFLIAKDHISHAVDRLLDAAAWLLDSTLACTTKPIVTAALWSVEGAQKFWRVVDPILSPVWQVFAEQLLAILHALEQAAASLWKLTQRISLAICNQAVRAWQAAARAVSTVVEVICRIWRAACDQMLKAWQVAARAVATVLEVICRTWRAACDKVLRAWNAVQQAIADFVESVRQLVLAGCMRMMAFLSRMTTWVSRSLVCLLRVLSRCLWTCLCSVAYAIWQFLVTLFLTLRNIVYRPRCTVCERGCAKLRTLCFTCVGDHLVPRCSTCGVGWCKVGPRCFSCLVDYLFELPRCQVCTRGFKKIGSRCATCFVDQFRNRCAICQQGYRKLGSLCFTCQADCHLCRCAGCEQGYRKIGTRCLSCFYSALLVHDHLTSVHLL